MTIALVVAATIEGPARAASDGSRSWPVTSSEEAWKPLPKAIKGGGSPPPTWVRATAHYLPHTTAAILGFDRLHRTENTLGPSLPAKMRWVAADANHFEYSRAAAEAGLRRAGIPESELADLKGGARVGNRACGFELRRSAPEASQPQRAVLQLAPHRPDPHRLKHFTHMADRANPHSQRRPSPKRQRCPDRAAPTSAN
jgi:hypothetical protein